MKTEQGLLRFDRMNESTWCFDMGYQVIPVATGMSLSIQLADRFELVEVFELPDNALAVMLNKKNENGGCKHLLDPNKRYLAKMPTTTVDEMILRAEMFREEPSSHSHVQDDENDSSDLPF